MNNAGCASPRIHAKYAPHLLSFVVGFISLSQEILWIRYFGFANESLPQAFSFVLTAYLLGIALGAEIGRVATRRSDDLWRVAGIILTSSALVDLISPWAFASVFSNLDALQLYAAALACSTVAGMKAILFPIAHHLGTVQSANRVGRSMSFVYACNILGSALGPIVTGFLLLDFLTTQQCFVLMAAASLLGGITCLSQRWPIHYLFPVSVLGVAIAGFAALLPNTLVPAVAANVGHLKRVFENRHGIITLYEGGRGGDIVYGGNVYDGRANVDLAINSNGLHRVAVLSALQESPRRVLLIGLSIGSWLSVVESFPGVEEIEVVEINPGYLDVIRDYPVQNAAVNDPRVRIHIDDGRRWLRSRNGQKWDLVIANTTWHWRAYAANLLSQEFLGEIRAHLSEHAVFAYNATGSPDATATAAATFPYAALYDGFVFAADWNFLPVLSSPPANERLSKLLSNGAPLVASELASKFLSIPQEPLSISGARKSAKGIVITDNNLYSEFNGGRSLR